MLCPNCNKELPEGSKFCGYCGTAVVQEPVQELREPVIPPQNEEPELVQPKKSNKKLLLIGGAVVAAVLVVILLVSLFFGGSEAYVYMSDGNYMLLTDVDADAIKIASSKSDSDFGGTLSFSPDGKYLYYFTKFDSSEYTGTLCRAEYGKLKSDSNKNSKYIEVIDTDVYVNLIHTKDGLLYMSSDEELYYYDGKESTRISKDVSNYALGEDKNQLLYETGNYNDGYELYALELSKLNEPRQIASGYDYSYNLASFDSIVIKTENNGEEIWNEDTFEYESRSVLSLVNFAGESKELAEGGSIVMQSDEEVYYVTENGTALNLYDYVNDSTEAADAAAVEPDIESYAIPVYGYRMVTDSSKTEADCGELYTSCTKDLYWLGESTWWCYSMTDSVGSSWDQNSDALNAAMQSFIDKYQSAEDENGLIPVTDEVKAALKAINTAYYGEDGGQWIMMCYEKYQSGTDYDYEAYYTDVDVYQQAVNRNGMREELRDPENARRLMSLYRVKDGASEMVCDNVVGYDIVTDGIFYSTSDMLTDTMDLDEMEWYTDINQLFYLDEFAANYLYMIPTGKSCRMSDAAADTYGETCENGYPGVYVYGSEVFLLEDDDTLSVASVSGSEVDDFVILTDNGQILADTEDGVYYLSDIYESSGVYYGDLYCYTKGKSTLKAREVLVRTAYLYEDGQILAYTGGSSYGGFELTAFEKDGSSHLIADNVTQFVRQDSDTIFYISDQELYCVDKDERIRLDDEVSNIWVKDAMKVVGLYAYSYYGGY